MDWQLSEKQYKYLDDDTREIMIEGSAGSGKTTFACTKTIKYALEFAGARIGVFRQTLPALRKTAWLEIRELLMKYNIMFHENKSEGTITFPNGSVISFSGLDDLKKVRSLNLDFVYIEQAEEVDRDTYQELKLRVRNEVSKKYYGQLLLVVQPEGKDHWLYDYFYVKEFGKHIHFHYTENPFLPESHIKSYEDLKLLDDELYRKYTEGKWGNLTSLIFSNYDKEERGVFNYYTAGLDFGWNNPSCFLLIGWYDDEAYIVDEVYQSEVTTAELISLVRGMLDEHGLSVDDVDKVYADSASPEQMEEFYRDGFNVVPANKDVNGGIQTVKMTRLHVASRCENTLKELSSYKWQKDMHGNVIDKPVKVNDHAMDALRYCVYGVRGLLSPDRPSSNINLSEVHIY